jgi:lipopolysaccharide export LptBFGC system permease protein LptF
MMTKEAKKFSAEFLSRVAQVLFAMVLVGPFVTGNLKIGTTLMGIIGIAASLLAAILISLSIKED